MSSNAIFPLSADPLHVGHVEVIRAAAQRFDRLIVYVTSSESKSYLLSLNTRTRLVRRILGAVGLNVEVVSGQDSILDMCLIHDCRHLVRGYRNAADQAFEEQQHQVHLLMMPDLELCLIPTAPEHALVSSTLIKAMTAQRLDYSRFVPSPVVVWLLTEAMQTSRTVIRVDATHPDFGAWLTRVLMQAGIKQDKPYPRHFSWDAVREEVLNKTDPDPYMLRIRGLLERADPDDLNKINDYFLFRYRQALQGAGLLLLEWPGPNAPNNYYFRLNATGADLVDPDGRSVLRVDPDPEPRGSAPTIVNKIQQWITGVKL